MKGKQNFQGIYLQLKKLSNQTYITNIVHICKNSLKFSKQVLSKVCFKSKSFYDEIKCIEKYKKVNWYEKTNCCLVCNQLSNSYRTNTKALLYHLSILDQMNFLSKSNRLQNYNSELGSRKGRGSNPYRKKRNYQRNSTHRL